MNPISEVGTGTVPCPTAYVWSLEDVSAEESGRTEDTTMQKMRIAQVVSIDLEWKDVTIADAATILTAFNPEYLNVTYLDAMAGELVTKEFYVGNRNSPLFNTSLGKWEKISFKIIQRKGD